MLRLSFIFLKLYLPLIHCTFRLYKDAETAPIEIESEDATIDDGVEPELEQLREEEQTVEAIPIKDDGDDVQEEQEQSEEQVDIEEEGARPPQTPASQFPAIWSEEGKYLATVLGDALVKGLTQVSNERPDDPVEYLANFLKTYKNGEILATQIPPEVEARLKSGRAVTPGVIQRAIENQNNAGLETADKEMESKLESESKELIEKLDSGSDSDSIDQINNLDEQDDPEEENPESSATNGTRDDRGQSVLHFASARPGGASTILAFLQNPSVNLSWRDERLRTARDVAVGLGRAENVRVIDGWINSLSVAGDKESLEQLLLDGYDHIVDVEDGSKNHVVDLAEKAGKRDVAQFLRSIPDFQERLTKLHKAVRQGDLDSVKAFCLKDGKLPIALSSYGKSALHVAVLCEEYAIVKWLCEQFGSAVLRRGDNLDRTPLHYAMGVEKVEKMTRILVRNGAKRVVKDLRGRQPSYYFINREEIVELQKQERERKGKSDD